MLQRLHRITLWILFVGCWGFLTFVSCTPERDKPAKTFRFIDRVSHSTATYTRAELTSLRNEGYAGGYVTVRGQTRRSLVTSPSSKLSFATDIPTGSQLSFSIAVATLTKPKFASPIEFRLSIRNGERIEVLFRESIGRSKRNRWFDRTVHLGNWPEEKGEIVFETKTGSSEETLFPLWGTPSLTSGLKTIPPYNLILISIDCLRADHIGAYGYARDTTPSINMFAEHSVLFEQAIATSSTTLPTHMSMFTGLTPSEHGASNLTKLSAQAPYLPEILANSDFQVDGIVSGAYLAQNFGFERGFHSYLSLHQPRAARTVDAALSVLDRPTSQPRFLFVHFIDPHWPYQPPEGFQERFGPIQSDVPKMLNKVLKQIPPEGKHEITQAVDLYDAEIAYADQELGRFFVELKKRGLYDTSFILLTADHGEAFYEHKNWQHGWTLYDEIVHIPMILKWPKSKQQGRVATLVSQTDVFATLLGQTPVSLPHARSFDLTQNVEMRSQNRPRRYAISEFTSNPPPGEPPVKHISLRTSSNKYVASFQTDTDGFSIYDIITEELYDLHSDPLEIQNLANSSEAKLLSFRKGLAAYLEGARTFKSWQDGGLVLEDEAIIKRLKALGYMQ